MKLRSTLPLTALSLATLSLSPAALAQDGGDVFVSLQEGQSGRVFLDGQDTGVDAPGTLKGVTAGNHFLQVKGDCVSAVAQIDVQPGALKRAELDLQPLGGFVEIYLRTDGATLTIDGENYTGDYQALDLSCGSHELVASATNYTSQTRYLDVAMGEAYTVEFDLANQNAGTLSVVVEPVSAKVFIDGHEVSVGPVSLDTLVIGEHEVQIELDGYQSYSETIEVRSGEAARIDVALEALVLEVVEEPIVSAVDVPPVDNASGAGLDTRKVAGGATFGVSAILGVAGALTMKNAFAEVGNAQALYDAGGTRQEAIDYYDLNAVPAHRRSLLFLGLAGAGMVSGGVLFFTETGTPVMGYSARF